MGSITQPLPSSYLIFRAASESDGESPCSAGLRSDPPQQCPCPGGSLPSLDKTGARQACHSLARTSLGLSFPWGRTGIIAPVSHLL